MSELTIVTYHYVRDLAASRFPRLAALDAACFRRQLEHLARHHQVVTLETVLDALEGGALPERACLLTFDDGYRDHATVVAPALAQRGWSGVFFPAADAVEQRQLLEVNQIQFILAANADRAALAREVSTLIEEHRSAETPDAAELDRQWRRAGRWDDADTRFVKGVLQQGLPEDQRRACIAILFARHVSDDAGDFADTLYMDRADIAAMLDAGMAFGSHGACHQRMTLLDDAALDADLLASLVFLESCGIPVREGWTLCYPHGAQDARVRRRASAMGCRLAVTIEPAVADLENHDRLALPRLDTNDLPS